MSKAIRRITAILMIIPLLICFAFSVLAAKTLTYQEYLNLSTEEQLAYRATFSSSAEFKKWYKSAKQAYEDSQNKVTIGKDESINIGELINPPLGSGNCGDNLTWKLDKDYVLTISGSGAMYDYTADTLPWAGYAASIVKVKLPDTLTAIGDYAFYNCSKISAIDLSAAVTEIGDNAFSGCTGLTSVVYAGRYAAAPWNKDTGGSGNDALTNADITYKGELRISGATLALQHNISVEYNVKQETLKTYGFTDLYLVITFNGVTTTLTDYAENGDSYTFRFRNIAPNQMNDTLVATVYGTRNGVEYASESREYSVATYCYNQLAKYSDDAYAELRTLLVDLLNYGAAAQNYTSYNTANLVNSALTTDQAAWGTSTVPTLNDYTETKYQTVENPSVAWKGATLVLQDSVTMRYKIQATDITGLTAKFVCDGQTWTIPASQFVQDSTDTYYIYFNGLHAGQMRGLVYVTIYDGETPVSNTVQYSIESYASGKITNESLKDIVTAMMRYGDSANAYAN